jgi:hypothetical protein
MCIVRVRRNHLVDDALDEIARQYRRDLFKPLRVHFIGEEGIDAGARAARAPPAGPVWLFLGPPRPPSWAERRCKPWHFSRHPDSAPPRFCNAHRPAPTNPQAA